MTDDEQLRKWMDEQFGCPHADRSTASYALEFLKTTSANLVYHQKRTQVNVMIADVNRALDQIADSGKRMADILKEIQKHTPQQQA